MSNLFYQTNPPRPMLDRAEGIHFRVCPPINVTKARRDPFTQRRDGSLATSMAEIPQFSGAV